MRRANLSPIRERALSVVARWQFGRQRQRSSLTMDDRATCCDRMRLSVATASINAEFAARAVTATASASSSSSAASPAGLAAAASSSWSPPATSRPAAGWKVPAHVAYVVDASGDGSGGRCGQGVGRRTVS
jgi:hypothetical protein